MVRQDPALSNDDNFDQLRLSLALAADAYTQEGPARTAFGHFAAHHDEQIAQGLDRGLNPLIANFGPAQIDRAILDALGLIEGCSFYDAMRLNLAGLDPALLPHHVPDLAGFNMDAFLGGLTPAETVAARHTVGLVDVISGHPGQANDGLPESLEEVVAAYGHRYFKLKVGGDPPADLERLTEIAAVLSRIEAPYFVSLDGNEQYNDAAALGELWQRMEKTAALRRLVSGIMFIEQPITRVHALVNDVSALARTRPVIIDESDDGFEAFPRAKERGYSGVSSKCCKGLYKSIVNAARCTMWNAQEAARAGAGRYFMSGEDLTTQSGIAVQQDLALVNLIGLKHVERNGHHYVNGMMDLPEAEQAAFLVAHRDLYERRHGAVRLRIRNGELAVRSLAAPGFASGAYPDWTTLAALPLPARGERSRAKRAGEGGLSSHRLVDSAPHPNPLPAKSGEREL